MSQYSQIREMLLRDDRVKVLQGLHLPVLPLRAEGKDRVE